MQLPELSNGLDEGQCHKIQLYPVLSLSQDFFQLGCFPIAEVLGILSAETFRELQLLTSQWSRNKFFGNDLALYLHILEQLHLLQIFMEVFYGVEVQEWIHQFQNTFVQGTSKTNQNFHHFELIEETGLFPLQFLDLHMQILLLLEVIMKDCQPWTNTSVPIQHQRRSQTFPSVKPPL